MHRIKSTKSKVKDEFRPRIATKPELDAFILNKRTVYGDDALQRIPAKKAKTEKKLKTMNSQDTNESSDTEPESTPLPGEKECVLVQKCFRYNQWKAKQEEAAAKKAKQEPVGWVVLD